jgi:hypothetical protein
MERTETLIRYEAAKLISLTAPFNDSNDIHINASRAGLTLA